MAAKFHTSIVLCFESWGRRKMGAVIKMDIVGILKDRLNKLELPLRIIYLIIQIIIAILKLIETIKSVSKIV